jgi:hypothetical protein
MVRILVRIERDHPLRIAIWRHDDVGMPTRSLPVSTQPAPWQWSQMARWHRKLTRSISVFHCP